MPSRSRPTSRQTATLRAANSRLQPASTQAIHVPHRGKQRPTARQTAVYSHHPRQPFTAHLAANHAKPRGKQRPADLARSALVSRSLRARCALRAPRAARTGRLWRHVNRPADWENGRRDYLIIFRFGCAAALHNQSSRWISLPSAASLSI